MPNSTCTSSNEGSLVRILVAILVSFFLNDFLSFFFKQQEGRRVNECSQKPLLFRLGEWHFGVRDGRLGTLLHPLSVQETVPECGGEGRGGEEGRAELGLG